MAAPRPLWPERYPGEGGIGVSKETSPGGLAIEPPTGRRYRKFSIT